MNGRKSKSAHTLSVDIDKNICGFVVRERENVHPENVEMFAIEINNCQTTRFRFFRCTHYDSKVYGDVKSSGENHKSKHMHLSRNEQFGFNYFSRFYLCAAGEPLSHSSHSSLAFLFGHFEMLFEHTYA